MRDGIVFRKLEIGVGTRLEEVSQNGAELAGGPFPCIFRRLLGRFAVDHKIPVAFLPVLIHHFGGHHIDHLPVWLARFADVTRGHFLTDIIRQPFRIGSGC